MTHYSPALTIIWNRQHICASHLNSSTSTIFMLSVVHAACLVFWSSLIVFAFCRNYYKSRILQSVKGNNFHITWIHPTFFQKAICEFFSNPSCWFRCAFPKWFYSTLGKKYFSQFEVTWHSQKKTGWWVRILPNHRQTDYLIGALVFSGPLFI